MPQWRTVELPRLVGWRAWSWLTVPLQEAEAKKIAAAAEKRIVELEAQLAAIRAEKPLDEVTVGSCS